MPGCLAFEQSQGCFQGFPDQATGTVLSGEFHEELVPVVAGTEFSRRSTVHLLHYC